MLGVTRRKLWLIALVLGMLFGPAAIAQSMGTQTPDASMPGGRQQQQDKDDPFAAQRKQDMVKKQNELRQQEIKKDTDKLLELANELKQYVDKTNENIISLDVIKKAEQIEKLAHTVKDKMKGQ